MGDVSFHSNVSFNRTDQSKPLEQAKSLSIGAHRAKVEDNNAIEQFTKGIIKPAGSSSTQVRRSFIGKKAVPISSDKLNKVAQKALPKIEKQPPKDV